MKRTFPTCCSSIALEGFRSCDHHHPLVKLGTPSPRQIDPRTVHEGKLSYTKGILNSKGKHLLK